MGRKLWGCIAVNGLWALARTKVIVPRNPVFRKQEQQVSSLSVGTCTDFRDIHVPHDTVYVVAALKYHHFPVGVYSAQKRRKSNGLLAIIKANFL